MTKKYAWEDVFLLGFVLAIVFAFFLAIRRRKRKIHEMIWLEEITPFTQEHWVKLRDYGLLKGISPVGRTVDMIQTQQRISDWRNEWFKNHPLTWP